MYKLWLDDSRKPNEGWVWIKDYESFKGLVSAMGNPVEMSLDHDLNRYKTGKNGLDCVRWYLKWLKDTQKYISKKITIHSVNPQGSLEMENEIRKFLEETKQETELIIEPYMF